MRRRGLCLCGLLALTVFSACAPSRRLEVERSDSDLLYAAERHLRQKQYDEARESLQRLINRFPDSEHVPVARLGLGRAYYLDEKFDEARAEYLRFIEFFPQHERVDEAYYFLGMAYYQEMKPADRDQTSTHKALEAFDAVTVRMSDSPYAEDARTRALQCRERLAAHEIDVGIFYYRNIMYGAALRRFRGVLKRYPGASRRDTAVYYLGESLWELGQIEEAREAWGRLLREFPSSSHAPAAARRLGGALTSPLPDPEKAPGVSRKGTKRPNREEAGT